MSTDRPYIFLTCDRKHIFFYLALLQKRVLHDKLDIYVFITI